MSKLSILIIDDSKLINNSLKASFEIRGFSVTQAFCVEEAKKILKEDDDFDYALLDLVLPDGDGEDVLPFLQIHENIRVIVMTSDRDSLRREHLFSFGVVVDYITKERRFEDMEAGIVELIGRISTNSDFTVMVVDDSNFMRSHLRILLSKRGFNVVGAQNGEEALISLQEHKIDAALVDLEMPVMDGNKLLQAIKKDPSYSMIPLMIISGSDDPAKVAKVIKNGASDFIKKPFATEELLLKIDKMISDLRYQKEIKIHEEKFAMYNKAIDRSAIFLKIDKDMKIKSANDNFCELLHKKTDDVINTFLSDHVLRDDSQKLAQLLRYIKAKEIYQDILSFASSSKDIVNIKFTVTPILDHNNVVAELVAIGFDVTLLETKESYLQSKIENHTQQKWDESKILIQQSKMAAMGEMIGNIAHQWRQPLNALGLMFQKLNIAYQNDKLNKELMENSMQKSMRIIEQMSKTIEDFKNFFKLEKHQQKFKLINIIEDVKSIIGMTLHDFGITMKINATNEIVLVGYKNELSQVVLNIISNAKDAIVENSVEHAQINITLTENEDNAIVIIDDNAGGIDEQIIDKIFEPYFTTKDDSKGTGIGLYMSKVIIEENMRGKLEAFNTLSGASFKITVPKNIN